MTVRRAALWVAVFVAAVIFGLPPLVAALGMGPDPGLLPERGRTQPIGEARALHYYEEGVRERGTPIVLVHGLPSCAADWTTLPALLAERAHRRVIAYDRTGYGYSTRSDPNDETAYSPESNARDLLDFLDALRIDRAVLVGWSYGGGVTQTFANLYPERLERAVLLSSTGPALEVREPSAVEAMMDSSWGQRVLHWAGRIPPLARAASRGMLESAFSREDAIPPGWADYTVAMVSQPGTLVAQATETRRSDPAALRPETMRVPVLVVHGTDDLRIPYAVAEDLHERIPESKLVPIFEGSHMLPVTHPEQLAEELARFVAP